MRCRSACCIIRSFSSRPRESPGPYVPPKTHNNRPQRALAYAKHAQSTVTVPASHSLCLYRLYRHQRRRRHTCTRIPFATVVGEGDANRLEETENGDRQCCSTRHCLHLSLFLFLFTRRCHRSPKAHPAIRIFRLLLCGLENLDHGRMRGQKKFG
jgi:hypothetical protein